MPVTVLNNLGQRQFLLSLNAIKDVATGTVSNVVLDLNANADNIFYISEILDILYY